MQLAVAIINKIKVVCDMSLGTSAMRRQSDQKSSAVNLG
jgi:hypothetical protein